MALKIFNSMTKKKELFKPVKEGFVKMYVCGPTVYDFIHIGNARTFVAFDVIRRYLEYKGFNVLFVSNITDVGHLTSDSDTGEDKILKRAKRENVEPMELVERYIEEYHRDIDSLNIKRPDISPRATGHIVEIIDWVKKLIEKGYAYEKNGSVYFDVSKFKDYGKLSGNTLEKLKAGARVEVIEEKKDPFDFAMWKKAEPEHLMKWNSPWGKGYPGWHIECNVMAIKYLGETLDIHGGGKDLKFPHHENEIAQAEAVTGKTFVNYWMHAEFINIKGEKMSKSKGNFFTARDIIEKYGPEITRFYLASMHYRNEVNFDDELIKSAEASLERINTFLEKINLNKKNKKDEKIEKLFENTKKEFIEAMDDDFNVPLALSKVFDLIRELNLYLEKNEIDKKSFEKVKNFIEKDLSSILGVNFGKKKVVYSDDLEKVMKILIEMREDARKKQDFKTADSIRDNLKRIGIILEDTEQGVKWKKE